MKKKYFYILMLLGLGVLTTYSCTKTDDPDDNGGGDLGKKKVLIKRENVQALDFFTQTYAFNADKNVVKEVFLDKNNAFLQAHVFKYDASQKMISSTNFLDAALTNIGSVTNFTYNASSQVTKTVKDELGSITTITYTYQSGKLMKAETAFSGSSSLPPFELHFEWVGDNMSKMLIKIPDTTGAGGFMDDHYVLYTYDSKVNPYYNMKLLRLDPLFLSKNNMLKAETYDPNSIKLYLETYDFKYDGDYPATANYDLGYLQGEYTYFYSEL